TRDADDRVTPRTLAVHPPARQLRGTVAMMRIPDRTQPLAHLHRIDLAPARLLAAGRYRPAVAHAAQQRQHLGRCQPEWHPRLLGLEQLAVAGTPLALRLRDPLFQPVDLLARAAGEAQCAEIEYPLAGRRLPPDLGDRRAVAARIEPDHGAFGLHHVTRKLT